MNADREIRYIASTAVFFLSLVVTLAVTTALRERHRDLMEEEAIQRGKAYATKLEREVEALRREQMKSLSYQDWRAAGYQVRRGERAATRDPKTGVALFTREQVDPIPDQELGHDAFRDISDHDIDPDIGDR